MFKGSDEVLGMNARNLLYISRYNSAANKKFADDKTFTKQFLESRGIGVAKTYHVIRNYLQLTPQFFSGLPKTFIIKPNKGYGGGGILVIDRKKGDYFFTINDEKYSSTDLFNHCISILEGKYSISGVSDTIIFEERLVPHNDMRVLGPQGLPDIRIIIFNMVPVMAMLRIPTEESKGKANMELGAIALGIDMGTGITTGGAKYSRYISRLDNGHLAQGFQIPFWDTLLAYVVKAQQSTGIGFLGVDLVVTNNGVSVLELNARPGLKIQIANNAPLKQRLNKVKDLKVLGVAEGVKMAKTLFSEKKSVEAVSLLHKKIISIYEKVAIHGDTTKYVQMKVNLERDKNIISPDLYTSNRLDITLKGQRIKLPVEKGDTEDVDIILGAKFLTDFLIDPTKKQDKGATEVLTSNIDEKMLKNIDERLSDIDSQMKVLSYINPRNLIEQKEIFFHQNNYSPRFIYKDIGFDTDAVIRELKRLPEVNHPLYEVFKKKINELILKTSMLAERENVNLLRQYSKEVFGTVTPSLYRQAIKFLENKSSVGEPDKSPMITDSKKIESILNTFLKKYHLRNWKIKIIEETVSDIQISKNNLILLKKNAIFSSHRLESLLYHEIGTHIFRYENGQQQPFRIFERGTAGYLETEEGLAIYNQNQRNITLGNKYYTPAYLVIALYMSEKMGFCDLFHYLKDLYRLDDELLWKLCIKVKRGFVNTENKGSFTKDILYFKGLQNIEKFIEKGGDIHDLYYGKICISDLDWVKNLEGIKKPKLVIS